ncbi:DODA-type extradiol aromatic ring-opening family dioxygenase [Fundidesulfovibrio terrae]|uniref:DODA-type extradiol aromatic ring-opening family dioxygenase n=1 Tax=Fundidesulfovibrio terrae TaxID=2922866 RepID=UPI001FAE9300|nr:class III extradiol ring-cleavage dioxygenase [Fundidesulfovibrio terrae]
MPTPFPSLFVSHGAPTLVIDPCPTHDFLKSLGSRLGRPRGVVCATAHWTAPAPVLSATAHPETIHDFWGFPDELYRMRYEAPGDAALAGRARELLAEAGIGAGIDAERGLDHGTWVPLKLMYPDAEVPVAQLSVQPRLGPEHHLAMGRALAPLRDEGVLVMGSGSLTHNLRDLRTPGTPPVPYAVDFARWAVDMVESGREADLTAYPEKGPAGARNHPTSEHFLPLLVAMGAGERRGRIVHDDMMYGVLSMGAFLWD